MKASDLNQVVDVYETALREGRKPLMAVASELGVSRGTAIRRMRQAREQGLTSATMADKKNRQVLAIAKELGVKYEDLYAALVAHTKGNLVIKEWAKRDKS